MRRHLKRQAVTSSVAAGLFIVGLLVGAGVVYGIASAGYFGGATQTVTTTVGGQVSTSTVTFTQTGTLGGGLCNGQTITIGALNDLSGELSSQGQEDFLKEQMAIEDVNAFLKAAHCNLTFKLDNRDYKLDAPTALAQLQALFAEGVQVVVGPLDSGTTQYVLGYANSNHIVLISPSSTSPALAIPNDYLFRTAPNDAAQGQADARVMLDRGAKAVILVNRDDTYGNGLANATKTFLLKDDPNVIIKGPYKYDISTKDFTPLLSQINNDFNALASQVGADHVAIFIVSFEEIGTMLIQANQNFPNLLNTPLPWFGTDGTAQNSKIINASTSGPYAAKVRLPSTLFNVVNNSKTIEFAQRFHQKYPNIPNTFYGYEGYDDVWLAALSIIAAGKNDGTAIHDVLPLVAANFYGLTGWEGLQPSGDRIPGSYQIWSVVTSNGKIQWQLAGTWDYSTDSVAWINPP